jgi:hypothetical protein
MNRMDFLLCRGSLTLLLVVALTALRTTAQELQETFSHPPKSFSAEDDKLPHPVPLPNCVRRLLASDQHVVNTLKYEQISPEKLPTDWFTASEQDLELTDGTLLVVMGAGLMRGANINPFWIFRQSTNACDLLLTVGAHDVEILTTKTNRLPDIETIALTAVRYFENQYRFDGRNYQVVKRTSQPIGEEIPHNLSDFETRKPLIQGAGQSLDPILCEARAWLWRQWRLEKPSYIKVILHSKEGDATTTTYFIRRASSDLSLMIQTHRILADRVPHSGALRRSVEDEIVLAVDIERRLALKNNPDRKTKVPENQEVSPDSYELYFNDDSGNNVAIL